MVERAAALDKCEAHHDRPAHACRYPKRGDGRDPTRTAASAAVTSGSSPGHDGGVGRVGRLQRQRGQQREAEDDTEGHHRQPWPVPALRHRDARRGQADADDDARQHGAQRGRGPGTEAGQGPPCRGEGKREGDDAEPGEQGAADRYRPAVQ